MQNWGIRSTSNYEGFNNWYNQIIADNIKKEPNAIDSGSLQTQQQPLAASWISSSNPVVENYFKLQSHLDALDQNIYSMPTSPANNSIPGGSSTDQQHSLLNPTQIIQLLQQNFHHSQQAASKNQLTSNVALGFNPLTPPGLPQAILTPFTHLYNQSTQHQHRNRQETLSPMSILENSEKATLTPRHTPPMDITPPKSPKATNGTNLTHHQRDQETVSNCDDDLKYIGKSEEEEAIRSPIFNSHGKMKNYKCKSCGWVAITKVIFWDHAKTHMKPEKILQCEKCPFVTELKHHLEYHTRKHKNLKPFQCDKCSYSCVNKSMLNSHRKSHSSVYQYRCTDCGYATKYCHSFKLHLRKYGHKQDTVLDEDGKPNPSLVIDVYGTRRGPKNKKSCSLSLKKVNTKYQTPGCSQLSAALQTTTHRTNNKISTSQNKSSSLGSTEQSAVTLNMSLMQQQHATSSQISPAKPSTVTAQNSNIPNIFPQLSASLPQPSELDILSYFNFHLAAQQHPAYVLLSPSMIDQLQKYQQDQSNQQDHKMEMGSCKDEDENEEEDVESEFDRKSIDSAMDLSRGTPIKYDQQQQSPESVSNAKIFVETPASSSTAARHKGRILKLDKEQLNIAEVSKASAPLATSELDNYAEDQFSSDEHTKTNQSYNSNKKKKNNNNPPNTTATSVTSFSRNSSNSSATAPSGSNSSGRTSPSETSNFYECKHCGIIFKNPVLHSMHMGFHTCDDVFKCNKCGVRCNSSIGFFLHISCKAHS